MLKITASSYQQIRHHGEETYPHECCGILVGTSEGATRTVRSILRCSNARTDTPQNRYRIAPRELIDAQREARERGLDIVGFYHSHPDHPPRWSPTDLDEAHWIGCSYVITSIEKGKAAMTNSFVLTSRGAQEKAFEEEEVVAEP